MLDTGVVRFDFSGGGTSDDEDLDLFPSAADGPPEPGRFRLLGSLHQLFEAFFGQLSVF